MEQSEIHTYANSWLTINGRPLVRFSGRNIIELIFFYISVIGIPLTLYTIFIILTRTPPQLKKYKRILLNLTVTVFLTDVTICFLFDPLPLFPEIACYSESWIANTAKDANYILFCISILLLQLSFCGTLVAFLHRLNALQPLPGKLQYLSHHNTLKNTVVIYLIGNIPVIIVLISSYKAQEEMEEILKNKPQLQFLKGYRSYLVTQEDDHRFVEFQVVWLTSALLIILLCGIIAGIVIVHLQGRRQFMSSKSIELHRYLIFHLIMQSLTPTLSVVIPMMILFSTRYFQAPFGAKFWNAVISQAVALHSPINTIAILFATKHYRAVLCKPFKRIFETFSGKKVASNMSTITGDRAGAWQGNTTQLRTHW